MNLHRTLIGAAIGGLLTVVAGVGIAPLESASARVPAEDVPAGLTAAIKATVESRGEVYVGDCSTATIKDIGKRCSTVGEIADGKATVFIGMPFSDDIFEARYSVSNGTWVQVGGVESPTGGAGQPGGNPGTDPGPPTSNVPAGLTAAIKATVESRGEVYVGDCSTATIKDIGKRCSNVGEIADGKATVFIGMPFSDDIFEAHYSLSNGAWAQVGGNTGDGSGNPQPAPGGEAPEPQPGEVHTTSGENSELPLVAGILGALAAAGVAGLGVAARKRHDRTALAR
ncbi:MAG: hypothetical protein HY875_01695 [Chloroflexi bacterium]|nr:hypothetical protein [Chloroflexota bacterium]